MGLKFQLCGEREDKIVFAEWTRHALSSSQSPSDAVGLATNVNVESRPSAKRLLCTCSFSPSLRANKLHSDGEGNLQAITSA